MDDKLESSLLALAGDPIAWILLAAYFAPTLIALLRNSAALNDCFICNVFFGWTGLGWFLLMLMAFCSPTRAQHAYRRKVQRARDDFFLRESQKASNPVSAPPAH